MNPFAGRIGQDPALDWSVGVSAVLGNPSRSPQPQVLVACTRIWAQALWGSFMVGTTVFPHTLFSEPAFRLCSFWWETSAFRYLLCRCLCLSWRAQKKMDWIAPQPLNPLPPQPSMAQFTQPNLDTYFRTCNALHSAEYPISFPLPKGQPRKRSTFIFRQTSLMLWLLLFFLCSVICY